MPPAALRALIAYYGHHTHWTERVEDLLLQLVHYTVNMNRSADSPPIGVEKFRPPMTREAPAAAGRRREADAERAAAGYGEHQ